MTEMPVRPAANAVLDDLLLPIPGVKSGKAFGHVAYKINGKIFCFVGDSYVVLKLPAPRVQSVIEGLAEASVFEPNGVWKEWVSLHHDDFDAYRQNEDLFHESLEFVSSQ